MATTIDYSICYTGVPMFFCRPCAAGSGSGGKGGGTRGGGGGGSGGSTDCWR